MDPSPSSLHHMGPGRYLCSCRGIMDLVWCCLQVMQAMPEVGEIAMVAS